MEKERYWRKSKNIFKKEQFNRTLHTHIRENKLTVNIFNLQRVLIKEK
jgi:hypothetical protein